MGEHQAAGIIREGRAGLAGLAFAAELNQPPPRAYQQKQKHDVPPCPHPACIPLTVLQVLLFYPDGKRSSSSDPQLAADGGGVHHMPAAAVPPPGIAAAQAAAAAAQAAPGGQHGAGGGGAGGGGGGGGAADGDAGYGGGGGGGGGGAAAGAGQGGAAGALVQHVPQAAAAMPQAAAMQLARMMPQPRRDTTNEYAALFVALIGEGPSPQGVVNTNEGKVVRAFHRFTLVDQTGQGRDLTKGRTREAGAVKISCARQDPNARNCHGYRKFVKVRQHSSRQHATAGLAAAGNERQRPVSRCTAAADCTSAGTTGMCSAAVVMHCTPPALP